MKDDFEDYLHSKRWTTKEQEDSFIGLTNVDMNTAAGFRQGWVEQAVHDIKKYEKENPEWKELGDKERKEFWRKKS
jgi:hypothetical protein